MLSASSHFSRARRLRKNMTDAERKLWYRIKRKQLGVRFRRQQPIGRYIVDFVCFERKVIIEVDGGQHDQCLGDTKRDACFGRQGYHVLRFWNNEVLRNIDGVIEAIRQEISPSPLSPPIKGGE
ncbi:endonuclease domain-containing protein [candidate division WOR-3 bacterium]|nr:endonuclease domain-containing protein [candidate division WOR-3 bacterium]